MDFKQELQAKIDLIEHALAEYLRENAPAEPSLAKAVRWAVSGGGKRIRPVLTLAFAELCGGEAKQAIPFAIAVELIHSYSLVHDDLPCMDDAGTRRGKASVHRQFGEATALLAGDALLTEAFAALCSGGLPPATAAEACKILALASGAQGGGMICGQMLEMALEGADIGESELKKICEGKTAALLAVACMLGVLAGAGAEESPDSGVSLSLAAWKYGRSVGLAFQMIDDIFDLEEDSAAGRVTFATLWGADKARAEAAALTREAKEALAVFDGDKSFLTALADWLLERGY